MPKGWCVAMSNGSNKKGVYYYEEDNKQDTQWDHPNMKIPDGWEKNLMKQKIAITTRKTRKNQATLTANRISEILENK